MKYFLLQPIMLDIEYGAIIKLTVNTTSIDLSSRGARPVNK